MNCKAVIIQEVEMTIQDDPTIARIREIRHRISEECGHDPHRLVARYIEMQKQYQSQLLAPPEESQSDIAEALQTELVNAG